MNFNVNIIFRLLKKGRIDKAYGNMYNVAEGIAIHETELFIEKMTVGYDKYKIKGADDASIKILNYREKRIEYHLNKMIELIKLFKEERGKGD